MTRSSFGTQANALFIKNLIYQKRHIWTNVRLICIPVVLCLFLVILQNFVDKKLNELQKADCGKKNPKKIEMSNTCSVPQPNIWPPIMQVPYFDFRAVKSSSSSYTDLPDQSCRKSRDCPVTLLYTGNDQTIAQGFTKIMFDNSTEEGYKNNFLGSVLGTTKKLNAEIYIDPAFTDLKVNPISVIQYECEKGNPPKSFQIANTTIEPICIQGIYLWRNSTSEVNDELYKGYLKGNSKMELNEFAAAYDFSNSDGTKFNVTIWYNGTSETTTSTAPPLLRVPRLVNLVSNAYLKSLLGPDREMHFEFVKEMPKHETKFRFDLTSLLGTLFFTWIVLQLFPVVLTSVVYEKQQKLRLMMKMHGLGDGPYWMITYTYFLAISLLYMFCFVLFGSLIGLKVFLRNSYGIQFVFYFLFINLQIAVAFLLAAFFSHVKTAAVTAYICVFASGLLGSFLFESFIENKGLPREWIYILELYPGFSLYRGIYEFEMYAFTMLGAHGMQWGNLNDPKNGMKDVLIIIIVECIVVLVIAFYLDQVSSSGGGKSPLFFLQKFRKKSSLSFQTQGSSAGVDMEKHDVSQERDKVEQLIRDNNTSHAVIVNNLKKVYAGEDGNPDKFAVRGLSLALPQAECFGMLGPNGAGKTSFISMMIGLTKPTSGEAIVNGYDLQTEMDDIYTNIGVCPQFDLLWESLTGREHLLFYGRLKNLKGSALNNAVEESLRGVNLLSGGVADKFAGKYSGGMKRRLSVAISLIGDPKVVYLDEPSTGLDPASRNSLWDVVKQAKQGRAIILTTHSMEEAEALCDRLGIFVDGSLQCIGNPKELKGRYGGFYVFTMTTSADHEKEVERLVHQLSPDANKIYHLSGTQKFELPKQDVNIAQVFQAVEKAKSMFTVFAWGLADTTLEDVFIKVAQAALDAANA